MFETVFQALLYALSLALLVQQCPIPVASKRLSAHRSPPTSRSCHSFAVRVRRKSSCAEDMYRLRSIPETKDLPSFMPGGRKVDYSHECMEHKVYSSLLFMNYYLFPYRQLQAYYCSHSARVHSQKWYARIYQSRSTTSRAAKTCKQHKYRTVSIKIS